MDIQYDGKLMVIKFETLKEKENFLNHFRKIMDLNKGDFEIIGED